MSIKVLRILGLNNMYITNTYVLTFKVHSVFIYFFENMLNYLFDNFNCFS